MKKNLTAFLCLLLLAPAAIWAQCNPQLSWMAAPSLNNLLKVDFYNTTTPPAQAFTSFTMAFGDGTPTQNIITGTSHNYAAPGTYTVKLYMHSYDSLTQQVLCNDSVAQQVTVSYPACGATITSINNGGGSYTFNAVNPANTAGLSYSWNYGDGYTGTGASVSHTYASAGVFNVTLSVTGAGCSYGNETYVTTMANVNCDSFFAVFTSSVTGSVGHFTNISFYPSYLTGLAIYRDADWYFGDGSVGYGDVTSHSYAAAGTYNVTMVHQFRDSLTQGVYCTDTVVHQVTVSNPQQPNYISGLVYMDSLNVPMPDTIKIWLIAHDTVANTLEAIDSTTASPYYNYYAFYNHAAGNYLVKAAIVNQPAGVSGWVPTYHDSSLYWGGASVISHTGGITANKHIWMQTGITTSGPGFIGGNISMGAGKGTGTGIEGMLVFLRDNSSNEVITFTHTDADGDYAFEHIPAGSYNIYPEAINYATIPTASLSIQTGNLSKDGVDFEQTADEIRPKGATGIIEKGTEQYADIYPNPAQDVVYIKTVNDYYNKATLLNTLGQVISTQDIRKGMNRMSTATLAPGMYYLMLGGKDNSRTVKINKR